MIFIGMTPQWQRFLTVCFPGQRNLRFLFFFKKDINRQAGEGMTVSSCYDISDTGTHLFFTRYATLNVTINGLKTIH